MLKKRIIFIIYYADGYFHLSRNFKLQRIGDVNLLFSKFGFSDILKGLDELVILNVSRDNSSFNLKQYNSFVEKLLSEAFVPISLGGGLRNMNQIDHNFLLGCDKVVFNSVFFNDKKLIQDTINKYGSQATIIDFDFSKIDDNYFLFSENGLKNEGLAKNHFDDINSLQFGEILLNSIDMDGTGFGPDLNILNFIDSDKPLILSGGFGKPEHFNSLNNDKIDAVATGNIFNFLRGGLTNTREYCIKKNINIRY